MICLSFEKINTLLFISVALTIPPLSIPKHSVLFTSIKQQMLTEASGYERWHRVQE